jgi:hypothetical protein
MRRLLELVEKKTCLIVTPMPHYITRGCCNDKSHVTNREEPIYKNIILASLEDLRKNLKDFLYLNGKRYVKIVDPTYDMRSMADSEIWGVEDPIHPKPEVYNKLVEWVIKLRQMVLDKKEAASSAHKRRRADTAKRDLDGHRDAWRPRALAHYEYQKYENKRGGAGSASVPGGDQGGYRGGYRGRSSYRGGHRGSRGWQH